VLQAVPLTGVGPAVAPGHGLMASQGFEMLKHLMTVFAALLACVVVGSSWADGASTEELRSLDEQVQEIKTDVLGIAAELSMLEERLLYPSNTQLALFVALAPEESFRLDAVRIHIDGELAAHHIYSFKELDALRSGGVQRIFTGNVSGGEHQLEVSVIGKLESGKDYTHSEQFTFEKGIDPRLLGIALAGPGAGTPPIDLQDW
jgi:hypothetical protein